MEGKTLAAYMDLVRDGSPSSGTHWSRCRGAQRVYAKAWLESYDRECEAAHRKFRNRCIALAIICLVTTCWLWRWLL